MTGRWFPLMLLTLAAIAASGCIGEQASAADPTQSDAKKTYWQPGAAMPQPVLFHGISLAEGNAVLTGGLILGASTNHVLVYDIERDAWSSPCRLVKPRDSHVQVTIDAGHVLILGGQHRVMGGPPTSPTDCEIVDINTGESRQTDALPAPMPRPRALMLPNGNVAAIGSKFAAVFDVQTETWSEPIELQFERRNHIALLVGDHHVLAVAGSGRRSVELVDLKAGTTFVPDVRLPFPLDDMQALVLPDGRVWVIGGQRGITGETVAKTWLLTQADDGSVDIAEGPAIPHEAGIADAQLVQAGDRWLMMGGESESARRDTELANTFLLDLSKPAVLPGPMLQVAHDDARAVATQDWIVMFGGYLPNAITLGPLKIPGGIRRVERLRVSDLSAGDFD